MMPEGLYKEWYGDAESVSKEDVLDLLRHFAAALDEERKKNKPTYTKVGGKAVEARRIAFEAVKHHIKDIEVAITEAAKTGMNSVKITMPATIAWTLKSYFERQGFKVTIMPGYDKVDLVLLIDWK